MTRREQREAASYITSLTLSLAQLARNQDLLFLSELLAKAGAEAHDIAQGKEPTPPASRVRPEDLLAQLLGSRSEPKPARDATKKKPTAPDRSGGRR